MRLILWERKARARAQFPRPLPPGQPAWRDIGHADAPQQGVLHALFGRKFHQRFGRIAPRGPGRHCERSEAIHPFFTRQDGLLRFARKKQHVKALIFPSFFFAFQAALAMGCKVTSKPSLAIWFTNRFTLISGGRWSK